MSIWDRQKKPIEFDKEPIKPFGADMDFRELSTGGGSKLFKVNAEGLFMGADNYTSAPFKVNYSGSLSAGTTTLTGTLTVSGGAIQTGASGERVEIISSIMNVYEAGTPGALRQKIVGSTHQFHDSNGTYAGFVTSASNASINYIQMRAYDDGTSGGLNIEIVRATNIISINCGGHRVYNCGNILPSSAASANLGDATNYWGDVSYKTLTDRGCLGSCDDGVELQDGRIVSDTGAIKAIKKRDDNKKTVYGMTMLDYKTFPKMSYKPAQKKGETEGVEMTSMFSVMLGAIRELTNRIEQLEKKIT